MVTILFGVATNKITALVVGAHGIAVIGIFRSLTGFVSGTLLLGSNNVIVQRISTARSEEDARDVVRAAFRFLSLQTLLLVPIALVFARPISLWLFGNGGVPHVNDVRVALLMVTGVLALQIVVEVLNGRALVRQVSNVNVFTSGLTALTIYPILRLGNVGLAMVIGFSCFFGAALGVQYVWRFYGLSWRRLTSLPPRRLFRTIPVSLFVTFRTIATTGTLLAVQSIVNRHYGISSLGLYNAASTIETTAMTLLTSAMRSYYLPILGQIPDPTEKRAFINRVLRVLLLLLLPCGVVLVFSARYVIWLLFSKTFVGAGTYAAVLGMSMVAQAYLYCSAFFVIHKANYRLGMLLDVGWAASYLIGALACVHFAWPLVAVAAAYSVSYCICAVSYMIANWLFYREALISFGNIVLGPAVLAIIGGAFFAVHLGVVAQVAYAVVAFGMAAGLVRTLLRAQAKLAR